MTFVAEFQGTPPFYLTYNIIRQSGKTKEVKKMSEKSGGTRHTFSYRPEAGGYVEENALCDDSDTSQ